MNSIGMYIRVSSEEQKKFGHSIHQQQEVLYNIIEREHGYIDGIKIYNDEGYSASKMNRPAYLELIEDMEEGRLKHIYMLRLDRINRNLTESLIFLHRANELNITVSTSEEIVDMDNPDAELGIHIKSIFAHFEQRLISKRTKEGLEGGLRKGKWSYGGKRPFGYITDVEGRLIFNMEVYKTVTNIIEDFISYTSTVNHVAVKNGVDFYIAHGILTNVIYSGYKIYNNNKYYLTKDIYIDEKVREKIMEKFEILEKRNKNVYLFKDKLYCLSCGEKLACSSTPKKDIVYLYYQCSNNLCSDYNKRINEINVVQLLNGYTSKLFINELPHLLDKHKDEDKILAEKINSTKAKLKKINQKRERLINLYTNYDISTSDFDKKNKQLLAQERKEAQFLKEISGSFNYSKHLKSLILKEYLQEFYISVKTHSYKEKKQQ